MKIRIRAAVNLSIGTPFPVNDCHDFRVLLTGGRYDISYKAETLKNLEHPVKRCQTNYRRFDSTHENEKQIAELDSPAFLYLQEDEGINIDSHSYSYPSNAGKETGACD